MRKRVMGLVSTICIIFALFLTGCQNSQTTSATADSTKNINAPGTYPIVKKPITISAMINQAADLQNYNTNAFTKHVEKLTNINIKFDAIPQADFQTKEPLELSSGTYPEIFLNGNFNHTQMEKYGAQQHILIPLEDLINKYAPNIKKAFDQNPELKAGMTAPDGHIYAIPNYNVCLHCMYSKKYWINTNWLKQLGMNAPKTTAEFEATLKAFKQKYPNSYPLTGEGPGNQDNWQTDLTPFLMNSFIYDDGSDYLYMNNGKVDLAANKPQWQAGLQYMNKLYKEGLMDPNTFTQNNNQLTQKGHQTPAKIGVFPGGVSWSIQPNGASSQWLEYKTLAPLKGPEGVQYSAYLAAVGGANGVGTGTFAISNKASKEQQVAAIRLADYLYTFDGTQGSTVGVTGRMIYKAKPGELGLTDQPAVLENDPKLWTMQTQNENWDQNTASYRPAWFRALTAASRDPKDPSYAELLLQQESVKNYQPYTPPTSTIVPSDYLWADPSTANDEAQLQTSIQNYVNTWTAQFITGQKDINKDWNTYVAGFKGLNLDHYLTILQQQVDTLNKQFPDWPKYLQPPSANPPAGFKPSDLFWITK